MTINYEAAKHCNACKGQGFISWVDPTDPMEPDKVVVKFCSVCQRERTDFTDLNLRGKWDDIWMSLATDIASRSTCNVPRRHIGCVIVSDDNTKVLSLGYNGSAKGDDNGCEYDPDRNDVKVGTSHCTCVHAEMNALTKLDTSSPYKKRMYMTTSPCKLCYKLIVNAGIDEVIYMALYDQWVLDELERLGVSVREYV